MFRSGCVPDGDLAAWLLAQNDALGARDDEPSEPAAASREASSEGEEAGR